MSENQSDKSYYGLAAVLLGLVLAQALGTLQVFLSNRALYQTMSLVSEAGYLAVPNRYITETMTGVAPAFFGGLFFTLTLGAGLSLAAVLLNYLWTRLFRSSRVVLIVLALLWLGMIAGVNLRGLNLTASLYFIIIPPAVFTVAGRWSPGVAGRKAWTYRAIFIAPLVVLGLLWSTQLNEDAFLGIRDNLLLSNSTGKRFNDFYYKYTLYPAEVFKTLSQKQIKTCDASVVESEAYYSQFERLLLYYDYLPLSGAARVDLTIGLEEGLLVFKHGGKAIKTLSAKEFLAEPLRTLKDFSSRIDRYGFFRKATVLSLLLGSPLLLYAGIFSVVYFPLTLIIGRVFPNRKESSRTMALAGASLVCFLAGLSLLIPLLLSKAVPINAGNLEKVLESPDRIERLAALKYIVKEKMDIGRFPAYQDILDSPSIPERYWLAQALGLSSDSGAYRDLLSMLNDPSSDVVRAAIYGLGLRGNRRAGPEFINIVEASPEWYVQWYAYHSLRRLGWRQERLR